MNGLFFRRPIMNSKKHYLGTKKELIKKMSSILNDTDNYLITISKRGDQVISTDNVDENLIDQDSHHINFSSLQVVADK